MVHKKGFCTKLCSDYEYEGMLIFLCYDDQVVATINYEKGGDKLEIEIVSSKEGFPKRIFPLEEFFLALENAKALAIRCAKEDKAREY